MLERSAVDAALNELARLTPGTVALHERLRVATVSAPPKTIPAAAGSAIHHLHCLTTHLAKTHGRIVVEGLNAARDAAATGPRVRSPARIPTAWSTYAATCLQDELVRVTTSGLYHIVNHHVCGHVKEDQMGRALARTLRARHRINVMTAQQSIARYGVRRRPGPAVNVGRQDGLAGW